MLLMGIDLGTSSIKISIVDAQLQQFLAAATFPEAEADIFKNPEWLQTAKPLSYTAFVQGPKANIKAGTEVLVGNNAGIKIVD
jgi:xylulokinase